MFRAFDRMRRDMERMFHEFDREFYTDPFFPTPSLMDIDLLPALPSGMEQAPPQQQTAESTTEPQPPQPQQPQQGVERKTPSTQLATTDSQPISRPLQLWRQPLPSMRVDVVEKEKEFVVSAELPGIKKEAVKLSIQDGVMTISGENQQEQKQADEHNRRLERYYGHVSRSMMLPRNVDAAKISARHENGVLTISLPKTEQAVATHNIAIQ